MDAESFTQIDYRIADGVAVISLNRPERRNAWNGTMAIEYRWALHHADQDPAVAAVLVRGAGSNFCVGADAEILTEMDGRGGSYERTKADLPPFPAGAPAGLRHNHTVPLALSVPVIAAIDGSCAGAGFVLACYADIRLAAAGAKITASFAGLGLPAEYGIGWILPRIMGIQNAAEVLMVNTVMDAEEAMALGFVRRVWPTEEFEERAFDYVRHIARHSSPASLGVMKRQLHVDSLGDLHDAYERSVADMNRMVAGSDFSIGVRALRSRTAPVFRSADGS